MSDLVKKSKSEMSLAPSPMGATVAKMGFGGLGIWALAAIMPGGVFIWATLFIIAGLVF